jgi:hypothetical protein
MFSVPRTGCAITLHEGTGPVTGVILALAAKNSILNYEIFTLVPTNHLVSRKLVGV